MPRIKPGGRMGITQRREGWEDLFATRTRGDVGEGLGSILALSTATDLISFSGGFPDPATFPGPVLAEILRRLIAAGDASAMQYAPTPGLPGPRAFIAERLEQLEGRRPEEGEFLITSGAIEALELLSKTFLDPGDLVLVEGPTYLGAIMAFRSFQANVECVPIDDDGLDTEALERRLAGERVPKLLYTIADHQNPAGVSLSADRRRALVELAGQHGFLLVEDVAYREFGFAGERLTSLWSLAPDTVVQVGTFSKTFFPGVRLGWGAGPVEVVAKLVLAAMPFGLLLWGGSVRSLSLRGRSEHDRMAPAAPTQLSSPPPITDRIALGALTSTFPPELVERAGRIRAGRGPPAAGPRAAQGAVRHCRPAVGDPGDAGGMVSPLAGHGRGRDLPGCARQPRQPGVGSGKKRPWGGGGRVPDGAGGGAGGGGHPRDRRRRPGSLRQRGADAGPRAGPPGWPVGAGGAAAWRPAVCRRPAVAGHGRDRRGAGVAGQVRQQDRPKATR